MDRQSEIILGLMARGIPSHIAQGMTANMMVESRLDPGINELAPLVPGSRGGFGLNQWTGPRRRALESAAQARGVPVSDLGFQLDFTLEELQGPESNAFQKLMQAQTAEEAARIYSNAFLRPGIPHLDRRLAYARQLAGQGVPEQAPAAAQGTPQGQVEQQGGNALAQAMMAPRERQISDYVTFNALDPAAFMVQGPQNAFAAQQFQPRRYLTRG